MHKSFFLLVLFVSVLAFPAQASAASACFCYFGENNDCQKATIDQSVSDYETECTNTCQTIYKDAFKTTDSTDNVLLSSAKEITCNAAHANANQSVTKPFEGAVLPKLSLDTPSIDFSPILQKDGVLEISFLGEYIQGMYKYLISFSFIVAIVFLMIGGLQWTLGAASSEQMSKAKKRIKDAITGLILLLCVVVILDVVNPQLTALKPMTIQRIQPIEMSFAAELMDEAGESGGSPGLGLSEVINVPGEHKNAAGADTGLSNDDIKQAANANGIDECFLWAFAKKESGGKLLAIGHDENYNHNNKPVGARKKFLMSGMKYSGSLFDPPTTGAFNYKKMNSYSVFNNDTFQPNNPPNYGLDWRVSHGIGYIQLTIVPGKGTMGQQIEGPNGPEWARKVRGKWYTVSDLLNKDTALEATIRFFGPSCGKKSTVVDAMKCGLVSDAAVGRALAKYQKCPLEKNMTISAEDLKKYPAKGSH